MLDIALAYLRLGFSVVPAHSVTEGKCTCGNELCSSPGKHPRIPWQKFSGSRPTEAQVKRWWKDFPDSNICIVTGEVSDLSVIDVDGPLGLQSLEVAGLGYEILPETPTVATGKGMHLYFTYDPAAKTATGILPGVDIRSHGGIVIAPPSTHSSGKRYEWVEGRGLDDLQLAEFDWERLIELHERADLRDRRGDLWHEKLLSGVKEGGRNQAATRLAGRYFALGLTKQEVTLLLRGWNAKNTPPLAQKEIAGIVKSVAGRQAKEDAGRLLNGTAFTEESDEVGRTETLRQIARILGLELLAVQRITGDEAKYVLEFKEGTVKFTMAELFSPGAFQRGVCEATHRVIRKLTPRSVPSHEALVQWVVNIAEDVDAGEEATEHGELTSVLREYLSSQSIIPEGADMPQKGPFYRDEKIWISLLGLCQWAGLKWGLRTSTKAMAQRLRAWGAVTGRYTQGAISRQVWGIDPERVGNPDLAIALTGKEDT